MMGGRPPMGRSNFDAGPPPPMREEPPLPTAPPFTAFVVNLSFESTEEDVRGFFEPMNPISVRLVSGHDGRPRGYGYVEFETLDELKDALTYAGKEMHGRNVRVSVAEPSSRALRSAAADDATQWRRSTPLPNDDRRSGFRSDSGISGFENMSIASDGGRQGFGGKFVPSNDMPRRRAPIEPSEPSAGDAASDWRTGKPLTGRGPSRFGSDEGRGGGFGRRHNDLDFSSWRSNRAPADNATPPMERRKLDLKPRSATPLPSEPSPSSSSGRSNPFGAAKPVDMNERQRQIDEKIREQNNKRREELRKEDERKKNKGSFFPSRASDAWSTKDELAADAKPSVDKTTNETALENSN